MYKLTVIEHYLFRELVQGNATAVTIFNNVIESL